MDCKLLFSCPDSSADIDTGSDSDSDSDSTRRTAEHFYIIMLAAYWHTHHGPLSDEAQFYLLAHKNKALRILSRHLQLL